ncbi:hypothetical protein CN134_36680, partial [Sinorhizobium meliloti]
ERPSGRATPSLRDAPGDAPIQIDAVPKLIVAPHQGPSPRRKRRTSNHLPTKKTAANSKSRRTTSDHSP